MKLREHGYFNCDGLDPSETLLKVGAEKGYFNKTFCCFVKQDEQTPIESGELVLRT
jgi:hypothetical protein